MMNKQEAIKVLIALGFKFETTVQGWGTMEAEPYPVGKHHFTPRYRSVFIGECNGGFYVTSDIHGAMRKYRCRTVDDNAEIANIFGHGATLEEAIKQFTDNFKAKTYNVRA